MRFHISNITHKKIYVWIYRPVRDIAQFKQGEQSLGTTMLTLGHGHVETVKYASCSCCIMEQTEELEAQHIYEQLGGLQFECIFLGSITTIRNSLSLL